MTLYRAFGKRLFDLGVATPLLVIAFPVMAFLALLIRVRLGAPLMFRQPRPGQAGVPFVLLKFRTMADTRDASGNLLPDGERLTGLGKWLRNSSLDELPELWNVLCGHMSLVGPRPLLMQYLERYTPEQRRRHDVRPGITGLAQVSGRNALSWEQKFALDLEYVDRCSFWLDVKILARTASQVASRRGISHGGHASMPEFMGTRSA